MPKARQIFEAIDIGDNPDFFDPAKRRSIERREDPHTQHPAMGHSDVLASEGYQNVMRKIARYTGQDLNRIPRGPQGIMTLGMLMMNALGEVGEIEGGHEEELEALAVRLVLGMDEFSLAAQAVEQGELKIEAELTQDIDLEGAQMDAEDLSDKEEMQIAQVAKELDLETSKRRFLNMLTQGNAMQKSYAFHLAQDELDAIDPRLTNLYGVLMSVGEFGQYAFPTEMQQQAMGGGGGGMAGGSVRIKVDEDGTPVIYAQAITFPVLLQELVKGLMEYMSYSEDEDPDTRRHAISQADTLTAEPMAQMLGPAAWQRIVNMLPADKQRMLPYVYDHLVQMPAEQFHEFMTDIQAGGARARQEIAAMIREIEDEGLEESVASWIVKHKLK